MILRFLFALAVFGLSPAVLAQAETAPPEPRPITLDRSQAFEGLRDYVLLNGGEPAGRVTVYSRFTEAGDYVILDHSDSELLGVEEQLFMVFDGQTFAPKRVQVNGRFGAMYVDINWTWDGLRAQGQADTYNVDTGVHAHFDTPREMPGHTLTRGAVLFLANTLDLAEGRTLELNWFNSQNGQVRPIQLEVQGTETVTVPAGTFEVFRVEQTGGQPGNTLFITTEAPRRIVRIDVTGTEMELHLQSL